MVKISKQALVPIPVMTEDVKLSCDAGTTVEWYYQHDSITGQNPLTLDIFTKEIGGVFNCKDINTPNRIYEFVNLQPIGKCSILRSL